MTRTRLSLLLLSLFLLSILVTTPLVYARVLPAVWELAIILGAWAAFMASVHRTRDIRTFLADRRNHLTVFTVSVFLLCAFVGVPLAYAGLIAPYWVAVIMFTAVVSAIAFPLLLRARVSRHR